MGGGGTKCLGGISPLYETLKMYTVSKQTLQLPINKHSVPNHENYGAQYIGYTMRKLRERLIEYKTYFDGPIHRHMMGKHHFKLHVKF